jgi:hypothetical protein
VYWLPEAVHHSKAARSYISCPEGLLPPLGQRDTNYCQNAHSFPPSILFSSYLPSSQTMASLALILLFVPYGLADCFLPNGTLSTSEGAQPCSLDPANPLSSTCCNTKWDNPPGGDLKFGQPRDECLPNGLCRNRGNSSIEGKEAPPWTHYYRVYCTKKDWTGCVGVCNSGVSLMFPICRGVEKGLM